MSNFPTDFTDNHDLHEKIAIWFKDSLNRQAYAAVDRVKEKLTNYYNPHGFMMQDFNLLVDLVSEELHKNSEERKKLRAIAHAAKAAVEHCRLDAGYHQWQQLANAVYEYFPEEESTSKP
jgi:hypothetical protein